VCPARIVPYPSTLSRDVPEPTQLLFDLQPVEWRVHPVRSSEACYIRVTVPLPGRVKHESTTH